MLKRRAHAGQEGQTLVLALAFITFFALVAASVLTLAGAVEAQRGSTERTAAIDSVAEGSAQFAMSDAGHQPCGGTTAGSGTISFPAPSGSGSNTLTYTMPAGSAGCTTSSTSGNAPGTACELCILNSGPSVTPALSTNKGITVNGEVDTNGNISGSLTSTGSSSAIGLWNNATCTSCTSTPPANTTHHPLPFLDPLAGTLADPSSSASPQDFASGGGLIHPGVYSSISVQPGTVWMTSGVYIATGQISVAGAAGDLANADASSGTTTDSDSGGSVDSDSAGPTTSNAGDAGNGTGYTATTLTDTSKAWAANQWVGATVTVTLKHGTTTGTVKSNTASTLTLNAPWSTTPVAGNPYVVSTISYPTNTTLTDTSKGWTVNQWAGYVATVTLTGGTQETDTVRSNTANTLTMNNPWGTTPSPANGYVIARIGYTATTLVDPFKAWTANQWAGDVAVVTLAGGSQEAAFVTSNSATTLTVNPAWGTTPAGGNGFSVSKIAYTSNTLVDGSKAWTSNQWAGAVVTVTLSNNSTETGTVASNTAQTLTMTAPWPTTPSPGNSYVVTKTSVSYTSNTLTDTSKNQNVDTTKNWTATQWVGAIVTVTLSNGSTETDTVASNTSTTLTMSQNWTTTPALGNQYLVVAPVVIYLACPTLAPYWSCASSGQSGGYLATSGSGTFAVIASTAYGGLALFTDPNLIDPTGGNVVNVSGNGGNFGGTVYAPRGSVSIGGGGCCGTGVDVAGRMIVRALFISGNSNAVLMFTGAAPSSSSSTCLYFTDNLSGTEANGAAASAHARFETGCSSAGLNGAGQATRSSIISFTYG